MSQPARTGREFPEMTNSSVSSPLSPSFTHPFTQCLCYSGIASPQVTPGQRGQWQSHRIRLGQLGHPEEAGPALQGTVEAAWVL